MPQEATFPFYRQDYIEQSICLEKENTDVAHAWRCYYTPLKDEIRAAVIVYAPLYIQRAAPAPNKFSVRLAAISSSRHVARHGERAQESGRCHVFLKRWRARCCADLPRCCCERLTPLRVRQTVRFNHLFVLMLSRSPRH